MVLEEQRRRTLRVLDDLVNALAELGVFLGEELGPDSDVARRPGAAAVVRAIHAARRDADPHARGLHGIEHDRVEAETAATRRPARPVRVVEEPAHAVPCLPAVGGPEERRGLDATVEGVGLGGAAGDDLPDLLERQSALRREFDVGLLGLRPRPTPVVRRDEHRAPVHTRRARPDPPAARPAVMGQGVHGPAGEIGPPDFPGRPRGGCTQEEGSLHRAHQQHDVAALHRDAPRRHHGVLRSLKPTPCRGVRVTRVAPARIRGA